MISPFEYEIYRSATGGAYGKTGNLVPEPESGIGTGTGDGEINECFKLGSMININTPPLLSTFLARWMMVLGD